MSVCESPVGYIHDETFGYLMAGYDRTNYLVVKDHVIDLIHSLLFLHVASHLMKLCAT